VASPTPLSQRRASEQITSRRRHLPAAREMMNMLDPVKRSSTLRLISTPLLPSCAVALRNMPVTDRAPQSAFCFSACRLRGTVRVFSNSSVDGTLFWHRRGVADLNGNLRKHPVRLRTETSWRFLRFHRLPDDYTAGSNLPFFESGPWQSDTCDVVLQLLHLTWLPSTARCIPPDLQECSTT
jgi:hypothetical protein